ncbi:hypothetical protein SB765_32255, partial [Pseudomonas sp. SIMBA_067]
AGCSAHAVHDGLTDVIYVLLPIWQTQFALSYAQIGLLRGAYSGTMAVFQLMASRAAKRWGRPFQPGEFIEPRVVDSVLQALA